MATQRLETRLTARDETQRAFRTLKSNLNTVNTAFVNVAKVAGALGAVFAGVFIRDLVEVNKQFQSLQASLVTFTGSVENADTAFKILQDFAKQTPFSLQEVVGSFNILVAQGIKPTEAQLGSFADIAGGTSKSIMQFAEAVADASVGEFERLKEFGIKASKEGDKITLKMGDITKVVDNDSAAIVQALTEISDVAFAGGAARQAATLGGAITNLRDNVDSFMFAIGESGFGAALASSIRKLSDFIDGNDALAEMISDKMTKGLLVFVGALDLVFLNLEEIGNILDIVFGVLVIKKILAVGNQIVKFTRAIVTSQIALTAIKIITKNWMVALGTLGAGIGAAALATDDLKDKVSEQLAEFVETLKITNLVEGAMNALGLEFIDVEKQVEQFKKESGNMNAEVVRSDATLADLIPTIEGVSDKLDESTISTSDFQSALDSMKTRLSPVSAAITDLKDEKAALNAMVDAGVISVGEMDGALNALAREALGLDTTTDDLATRQKIANDAFAAGIIEGDEYKEILSGIKSEMIDYNAENEKTFGAGAIKGVKDYYEAISDNAANMQDLVGQSFGSLETTLSDFFQTGELDFGTFTDAIKKGLADLAAKAVITTGLNFLGDVFPSLSFADGGMVPGTGGPRADDVLARVSSGEYVVNAASVSKFGKGFFDAVNAGKMPGGGMGISKDIMESITPGFFLGGLIKKVTGIDIDIIGGIGDIIGDIADAIGDVIGVVSDAIKGMVEGIMSGDMTTIAALALPFILPGIGSAVFANLGAGQGFAAAVGNGMSSSFASGVLGSGASLSSIATSVGIEFAKDSFTDMLSSSLSDMILGITGGMGKSKGNFSTNRASRFSTLYNESAPYLAGMTGANVHAGDNVRVGERGPELFIPQRNGTVAPIKGNASDLIGAVNDMKEEIITLRRQLSRAMSAGQLAGARA